MFWIFTFETLVNYMSRNRQRRVESWIYLSEVQRRTGRRYKSEGSQGTEEVQAGWPSDVKERRKSQTKEGGGERGGQSKENQRRCGFTKSEKGSVYRKKRLAHRMRSCRRSLGTRNPTATRCGHLKLKSVGGGSKCLIGSRVSGRRGIGGRRMISSFKEFCHKGE